MFSREFCKKSKHTFSIEHLQTTASTQLDKCTILRPSLSMEGIKTNFYWSFNKTIGQNIKQSETKTLKRLFIQTMSQFSILGTIFISKIYLEKQNLI